VAESHCRRDGRCVEKIGVYEPQARGQSPELMMDVDRADYWTSVGAKATGTVSRLICKARAQNQK
jgi:small subunit ribosomal protein S16